MATQAESYVQRCLSRIMKGTRYRVGALLLAYLDEKGEARLGNGVVLSTPIVDDDAKCLAAMHWGMAVVRDQLGETMLLKRPLPEQPCAVSEEPSVSFDVTYMDQNEEPMSVWAEHENWIETEVEARGTAKEVSSTHEHKRAKVYRVTRELIGSYENGEEQTT